MSYALCYIYVKPEYRYSVKLCYMDKDSFIVHIKTKDVYKDTAKDVEKRFDASNYGIKRPLPLSKNKKVTGLMKDGIYGKIMTEFFGLRQKSIFLFNR